MPINWLKSQRLAILRDWEDTVGFPGSSVGKESACNAGDPGWIPGSGRSRRSSQRSSWRRDRLPTPVFFGFPGGSAGKESTCNAGDLDSIPGLGRSPGEGNSCPLQYSCLENFTMTFVLHESWYKKVMNCIPVLFLQRNQDGKVCGQLMCKLKWQEDWHRCSSKFILQSFHSKVTEERSQRSRCGMTSSPWGSLPVILAPFTLPLGEIVGV